MVGHDALSWSQPDGNVPAGVRKRGKIQANRTSVTCGVRGIPLSGVNWTACLGRSAETGRNPGDWNSDNLWSTGYSVCGRQVPSWP